MTFVNLKAVFDVSSSALARVTAAQNILMLELASQGWEEMPERPDRLRHVKTNIHYDRANLLKSLTNDSADPNYIALVTHTLRCGWNVVSPMGEVAHNDDPSAKFGMRDAMLSSISVGSGV